MENNQSLTYKKNNSKKKSIETMILFGLNYVGKTSLLLQLTKNRFEKKYLTTIGINYYLKEFENTNLSIWDTCGDEIEMEILPLHIYKQSSCFIIVLSYNSIESLNSTNHFIEYIKNKIEKVKCKDKKTFIALINKSDLKDKSFTLENAIHLLTENNPSILVAEISCKNNLSVLEFFKKVCDLLHNKNNINNNLNESLIKKRSNTIFYSGNFRINEESFVNEAHSKCC
jgi:small GTP-binding protein